MSQQWIAREREQHETANARHQRYVAVHEAIIRGLHAFEQQAITKAQAIEQLEEEAAAREELGLVGSTVRPSSACERLTRRKLIGQPTERHAASFKAIRARIPMLFTESGGSAQVRSVFARVEKKLSVCRPR